MIDSEPEAQRKAGTRALSFKAAAGRHIRREISAAGGACRYSMAFLRWVVLAIALGGALGLAGAAFSYCSGLASEIFGKNLWLAAFLPLAGLPIILAYKLAGCAGSRGTNTVILSVRSNENVPAALAPLVFAGTAVTHLFGGSSGREGAALQMGGSIGSVFGRLLKLDSKDLHVITMCGMSAAFAAVFGTPLTAAVFVIEVISVGLMYYSALVPCVASSLTAFYVSRALGSDIHTFTVGVIPVASILTLLRCVLLAALCAGLSILFCATLDGTRKLLVKYIPNQYLRVMAGGAAVAVLTFAVGKGDYNGPGMGIIQTMFTGNARPEAFILKLVITAITMGAGFKGGEIVPAFFVGAAFGNVMGGLIGLPPAFGSAIGLVTLFCGVTNCPIATLLLGIELFGADGLIYLAVATAVGYSLSGYFGLYDEQKIVYSKLKAEFIDRKTV